MADPYAERTAPRGALPAGPPPWLGVVAERGGAVLGAAEEHPPAASARLVAVTVTDTGVLPPIARLGAPQAAMLLLAGGGSERLGDLSELERGGVPLYALKHGPVGGPGGTPGAVEVEGDLIAAVLDAADADQVDWERDPDFDWLVAARVPGITSPEAEALCPRLLYAAHDRVYEHAELVADTKRRWHEAMSAAAAPAELLAATGWPPEPTGQDWKE